MKRLNKPIKLPGEPLKLTVDDLVRVRGGGPRDGKTKDGQFIAADYDYKSAG